MRHFHLGCQEEWRTHEHAPAFSHIMRSSLCILRPDTVSVPMKSPVFSARAAWARCSARETHGDRDGPQDPYMKTVADAGPEQPFYRSPVLFKNPNSWSPNGKWIVLSQLCAVLPEPGHKLAVSTEGASSCRWTSDGRALPFLGADRTRLWRAEVEPGVRCASECRKSSVRFPRTRSRRMRRPTVGASSRSCRIARGRAW